jgi:hypothetical protein
VKIVMLIAAFVSGLALYGLMLNVSEPTTIKIIITEVGSFILFFSGYYLLQLSNKIDQQME